MLLKLLPHIDALEPIPDNLMLSAFNELERSSASKSRREAANAVLPQAGDYLPDRYYLRSFITGDISIEDAKDIINTRKLYINRAGNLLPTILRLLGIRTEDKIYTALQIIEDCCHDFPHIASSSHPKKMRKQIIKRIEEIRMASNLLYDTLDDAWRHIEIEYDHHRRVASRTKRYSISPAGDLNDLRNDLAYLKFASELVLYRDQAGDEAFYVGHNKASTHIVECAYRLSVWCGRPPFVTTPGSDFALLSGFIYELASGKADTSLAGAINKFARSDQRSQIDHDELETRWQNSDEYFASVDADNFLHLRGKIEGLQKEEVFWKNMAANRDWSDLDRAQIIMRLSDVRAQIASANLEHGPFLIWASQQSRGDFERMRQEMEEREAEILKMQIELGRLTRQAQRD